MAYAVRKSRSTAKIVLRQARAAEIRSSLKIGKSDKVHAHAAIVAVKKAAKLPTAAKAAKRAVSRPAKRAASKAGAAELRVTGLKLKRRGRKI